MKKIPQQMKLRLLIFPIIFISIFEGFAKKGNITQVKFHSHALEGNLLGDSPNREVSVYLPPSYEKNNKKRYPSVYLLHGNSPRESAGDFNPATRWINEVHGGLSQPHQCMEGRRRV